MTSPLQEAEDTIAKLTEVLSRIATATPLSTNSRTAEDMSSWVYAVATTGLDIVNDRSPEMPAIEQSGSTISIETINVLQAFQLGFAGGETRLDLIDDGSLAKAVDEVLKRHQPITHTN